MKYNLVCIHPFASYDKGDMITDQDEVVKLMEDRDHHFVRVPAAEPVVAPAPVEMPAKK